MRVGGANILFYYSVKCGMVGVAERERNWERHYFFFGYPPRSLLVYVIDSGNFFSKPNFCSSSKRFFDRDLFNSTSPTMRAVILAAVLLLAPIMLAASQEEAEVVANLASLDSILGKKC